MNEHKKGSSEDKHTVCHHPCDLCNSTGYLENKEICPGCAGTGCKDKESCEPSGGLDCEI